MTPRTHQENQRMWFLLKQIRSVAVYSIRPLQVSLTMGKAVLKLSLVAITLFLLLPVILPSIFVFLIYDSSEAFDWNNLVCHQYPPPPPPPPERLS